MKTSPLLVVFCAAAILALPPAAPLTGADTQERRVISVEESFDSYARGEFDQVADAIGRLRDRIGFARELERRAPAWIEAAGSDEIPRRRLIVATVALEFARGIPVLINESTRAIYLLQWACRLVRRNPHQLEAEHLWHRAAVAMLQRILVNKPRDWEDPVWQVLRSHIGHGKNRFPTDPAWKLADAVAEEFGTWPYVPATDRPYRETSARRASRAYEKLLDEEAIGAEARLRLAYLMFRSGNAGDALSHLDQVEARSPDAMLLYLAAFVRGQIFEQTAEPDRAVAAYETAMSRLPHHGSAAAALAAIRFRQGRRAEAIELAAQSLRQAGEDPWRHYSRGDYRLPDLVRQLRESLR